MYVRMVSMTRPKPIRLDHDRWAVMRDSPTLPKAIIQRVKDKGGVDRYLVIKWDLNPAEQRLMAVCDSLQRADELVLWDNTPIVGYWDGPPNAHPAS